ncbi:MAG: hypothetical protein M1812_007138 [Candelaria pacifica]|nr:MAG: hypothetical protein M1812_007138 [Candelaria pacifica]
MLLSIRPLVLLSSILMSLDVLAFPINTINSDLSFGRNGSTQSWTYESSGSSFSSRVLSYLLLTSTSPSILSERPSLTHYRRGFPELGTLLHHVPTVKDIEKQLHFPPDTALFWSGTRNEAASYAKSHGLKTMDMAISGDTPWNTAWLQDPKVKDEYWDRASTAMVNVVSGTVYVMLVGGKDDPITHPGTVWTRMEWPDLKDGKNSKVKKVIRLDPKGHVVGQIWPA